MRRKGSPVATSTHLDCPLALGHAEAFSRLPLVHPYFVRQPADDFLSYPFSRLELLKGISKNR